MLLEQIHRFSMERRNITLWEFSSSYQFVHESAFQFFPHEQITQCNQADSRQYHLPTDGLAG